jgi:peroxisomal membrane protein 2/protein Mpv17
MSEVVAMAGQAYMKQLGAHPLRTKAITSGVLAGCSDAVAQKISGVKKLQFRRILLIMVLPISFLLSQLPSLLALICRSCDP